MNLTTGGPNANDDLLLTIKKFDNVKNLEIIVVFTHFRNFRDDVMNSISSNDKNFESLEIE